MGCCRFIWGCGGALPLVEIWWDAFVHKVVEWEAFIDPVRIECTQLKDRYTLSSRDQWTPLIPLVYLNWVHSILTRSTGYTLSSRDQLGTLYPQKINEQYQRAGTTGHYLPIMTLSVTRFSRYWNIPQDIVVTVSQQRKKVVSIFPSGDEFFSTTPTVKAPATYGKRRVKWE